YLTKLHERLLALPSTAWTCPCATLSSPRTNSITPWRAWMRTSRRWPRFVASRSPHETLKQITLFTVQNAQRTVLLGTDTTACRLTALIGPRLPPDGSIANPHPRSNIPNAPILARAPGIKGVHGSRRSLFRPTVPAESTRQGIAPLSAKGHEREACG